MKRKQNKRMGKRDGGSRKPRRGICWSCWGDVREKKDSVFGIIVTVKTSEI
jgi:hypothetical protein